MGITAVMRDLCRKLEDKTVWLAQINNPMGQVWSDQLFAPFPLSTALGQGSAKSLGFSISCADCSVGLAFHGCLATAVVAVSDDHYPKSTIQYSPYAVLLLFSRTKSGWEAPTHARAPPNRVSGILAPAPLPNAASLYASGPALVPIGRNPSRAKACARPRGNALAPNRD